MRQGKLIELRKVVVLDDDVIDQGDIMSGEELEDVRAKPFAVAKLQGDAEVDRALLLRGVDVGDEGVEQGHGQREGGRALEEDGAQVVAEPVRGDAEKGADVVRGGDETLRVRDELGRLQRQARGRRRGRAPFGKGGGAREGVPGRVDFDGGEAGEIVGQLGGLRGGRRVETPLAPVRVDVARCADEDGHDG